MAAITKPVTREIIEDFAKAIRERRMETAKPSKTVINFRTDIKDAIERTIWRVPIEILRYRKENGRIASDILDYQRNIGILDEKDEQAQATIAEFLEKKDPEKTGVLRKSIMHAGQQEPAIITCDGFLINGNRRKMVMESLHREFPEKDEFSYMKVVILPSFLVKMKGVAHLTCSKSRKLRTDINYKVTASQNTMALIVQSRLDGKSNSACHLEINYGMILVSLV